MLFVEADPRVLAALTETCSREPDLLVVGTAGDAREARRVAALTRPAVVLLDVVVPDAVTGLSLLRDLSGRSRCPVVAMSIRGDLRDASLAAGAVGFVDKSDGVDAILHAVRSTGRPIIRTGAPPPPPQGGQ